MLSPQSWGSPIDACLIHVCSWDFPMQRHILHISDRTLFPTPVPIRPYSPINHRDFNIYWGEEREKKGTCDLTKTEQVRIKVHLIKRDRYKEIARKDNMALFGVTPFSVTFWGHSLKRKSWVCSWLLFLCRDIWVKEIKKSKDIIESITTVWC